MSTQLITIKDSSIPEGQKFKNTSKRISTVEETILGSAFVGRGYFCATVGTITEEMIKEYIEKHKDEADNFTVDGDI